MSGLECGSLALEGIEAPALIIILGIVILIFGVGRSGQLGGELGKAVR